MTAPTSSFGADSQQPFLGRTLPNPSSTHGSSHGAHSAYWEDGQDTDHLISSHASSRPPSCAAHRHNCARNNVLRRHRGTLEAAAALRRSCCKMTQVVPATAAGTASTAPRAASAEHSCGRSTRAYRHDLNRQKLRSDVGSRCGRSLGRRAGRHGPAATSDQCRLHVCALVKVGRVWPRGTVPWLPSAQNHLKSRPGNPTHRVEQRGSGYELIHDIRVRRDT